MKIDNPESLDGKLKTIGFFTELSVDSQAEYEVAVEALLAMADFKSDLDDTFGEQVKLAYQAHKAAVAERKLYDVGLAEVEAGLREKVALFNPSLPSAHIAIVETWDVVIEDADQIPREFLTPDLRRLQSIVKSQRGSIMVPGVGALARRSVRVTAKLKEQEKVGV